MALFGKKKPGPTVTDEMTILHSDVQGFVILGERLSRDEVFALLSDYLTAMHRVVLDHDGQLVVPGGGDSTTAMFSGRGHAQRGASTAAEMMTALRALHERWGPQGLPLIEIAIGVNTGLMSVGNLGLYPEPYRFALGDHVNFGVRLSGINRNYGTSILVSESTHEPIAAGCTSREIDLIMVKGREKPIRIFELWSMAPPTPEEATRRLHWNKGLSAYRTRRFDAAIAAFGQSGNDFAATMYIQRCQAMRENPPGDGWDGVYTMTTR